MSKQQRTDMLMTGHLKIVTKAETKTRCLCRRRIDYHFISGMSSTHKSTMKCAISTRNSSEFHPPFYTYAEGILGIDPDQSLAPSSLEDEFPLTAWESIMYVLHPIREAVQNYSPIRARRRVMQRQSLHHHHNIVRSTLHESGPL